jgi:hypothetical protein
MESRFLQVIYFVLLDIVNFQAFFEFRFQGDQGDQFRPRLNLSI